MNDSTLRDIIPSDDEKPRGKYCLKFCKILFAAFILGILAVGIVVLGLALAVSGKSFMNYFLNFSNQTQGLQNSTWKKQHFNIHETPSTH